MGLVTAIETTPLVGDPELDDESPIVTHIVKVNPGEDVTAKILEARINGTPLEALCGHVWVPSRDPKKYPICDPCREVFELYRSFNPDGIRSEPGDLQS